MTDQADTVNETMAQRVQRLKEGSSRTDESDPQRAASAQRDPASQPQGEAGGHAPGSDGSGGTKTIDSQAASEALGEKTAQVTDGTKDGEKVRETPAGRLAESNDVVLGDQSGRAEKRKDAELKSDGSKSPHDVTSGGSRQDEGHRQAEALKSDAKAAATDPAFQAEAKARTI